MPQLFDQPYWHIARVVEGWPHVNHSPDQHYITVDTNGRQHFPFADMQPGDFFLMDTEDKPLVRSALAQHYKSMGRDTADPAAIWFTVRRPKDGDEDTYVCRRIQ